MPTQMDTWVEAHPGHHDDDLWWVRPRSDYPITQRRMSSPNRPPNRPAGSGPAQDAGSPNDDRASDLQQRLDKANAYFRHKAAAVFTDDLAIRLLSVLYQDSVLDLANFDACQHGIPLAKLTAANFCEVGASAIYITESGQRFIESIQRL